MIMLTMVGLLYFYVTKAGDPWFKFFYHGDFFMDDFHPRRLCYHMQIRPSSSSNLSFHETMVLKANGPKFPQGTMVPPSKWTQIQKENGPKFLWKLWFPKGNGPKFPKE